MYFLVDYSLADATPVRRKVNSIHADVSEEDSA